MNKLRLKIIDYYDDVKNQIDVECEKILASDKLSNEKKEQYSLQRARFLSEINQVLKFNLENFEKIKWDDEFLKDKNIDSILFRDKFCFHFQGNKTKNGDYKIGLLGKLVITNFFICEDVQKNLSLNNLRSKSCHKLNPKDLVLLSVIDGLLRTYWPGKDEIIDISCKESNRISKLFLSAKKIKKFERDDFDSMRHIMHRENIEKCYLSFDSLKFISKKILNIFEFVNELTLRFNYFFDYDYELFSDFEDLDKLVLNFTDIDLFNLPSDLFVGLENLKELIIENSSISSLGSDTFSNLLNLESLDLENNNIGKLRKSCFKGLDNLKILNLAENPISEFHIEAFIDLKSLTFLNLRNSLGTNIQVEHLNCLKNLEVLNVFKIIRDYGDEIDYKCTNIEDLDLPNLRFLGIDSDVVPKFKYLKLNFIHIAGLKEFDETSLKSQVDLTGVYLELGRGTKMDIIKKEMFKSLEKLSFLAFNFYDLNQNEIDYIQNNLEYYKAFLQCSKPDYKFCFGEDINYLEVSNYEEINDYIQNDLDLGDLTKKYVIDYYDRFIAIDIFD
ncbi:unnamed protein product [Brachionus calyciflorus]|uniref:Uncharacterized protein n=1 Tax=Brachionus calyciflorus TaxID=104777 RepID=A0A813QV91_9BILA|nr:unnamed protein product [Brachionus calyciflorus]